MLPKKWRPGGLPNTRSDGRGNCSPRAEVDMGKHIEGGRMALRQSLDNKHILHGSDRPVPQETA